jgi:aryl-alcohol dehydrogenase-like predicted oxidoreductase
MHYRRLGQSGLKVSALCLGTHTFGYTTDEAASFAVMDAFVEAGGNFIDTADIYSNWVAGHQGGESETVIGRWLCARGNRQQMVLATKARGRMWPGPNGEGLSRAHLLRACDDSLRRLQTDYIDLYQIHWDDTETPLEETLEALTDLVRIGKVRYLGCSNIPAWRLALALGVSERRHLAHYGSLQPHYNLAHRAEFERELEPLCLAQGIGVIPYSPLAGGFLSGKYRYGQALPATQRATEIEGDYCNERGWVILAALDAIAAEQGAPVGQVALAWLLARPAITAPINGARTPEQFQANLGALEIRLSQEQIRRLNEASAWVKD